MPKIYLRKNQENLFISFTLCTKSNPLVFNGNLLLEKTNQQKNLLPYVA